MSIHRLGLLIVSLICAVTTSGCMFTHALEKGTMTTEECSRAPSAYVLANGDFATEATIDTQFSSKWVEPGIRYLVVRSDQFPNLLDDSSNGDAYVHFSPIIYTRAPITPHRYVTTKPSTSVLAEYDPQLLHGASGPITIVSNTNSVPYQFNGTRTRIKIDGSIIGVTHSRRTSPVTYAVLIIPAVIADIVTYPIQIFVPLEMR